MAANPETLKQRNMDIQKEYNKLCSKKANNVTIYSHEYMLMKLAKQFYLSETTVERILKIDFDIDPAQYVLPLED